jgi:protocatechuate 3,4-dioxygenase beta subunit
LANGIDYSAKAGGTSVQFVTGGAGAININYGINNPAQFVSSTNPTMFVPVYKQGNPLGGGTTATADALLSFGYNSTGGTPANTIVATQQQIGSVWGLAYSSSAQRLFAGAFLKSHCGLGPGNGIPAQGPFVGTIYLVNPGAPTPVSFFADLDLLGFPTHAASGALQVQSNAARGLPANLTGKFTDTTTFIQIGKVGLGDIDLSDDGRYLFVMNLFDQKLYRIDLQNAASPVAPTAAQVTSYTLPTPPTNNNGVFRPFALKFWRGKLYVGGVATAENAGGTNNDLRAYVYELNNPTGAASFNATPVMNFPLNYTKGEATLTCTAGTRTGWFPWITANPVGCTSAAPGPRTAYPQPIFSDIEFDVDNHMVIGIMDRYGHQMGYNNQVGPLDVAANPTANEWNQRSGGDILRAAPNGSCTYVLEANGSVGGLTGGAGNGDGPGILNVANTAYTGIAGEFYRGDDWANNTGAVRHEETFVGGLAILPGSNETVATHFDPVNDPIGGTSPNAFSGGIVFFSSINGTKADGYIAFLDAAGNSGKGNGLGDVELLINSAPIEVGNRVWNDANGDGIQNPGEASLVNVTLELFLDANNDGVPDAVAIGTVTTDANGNYYFTSASGTDVLGTDYGVNITSNQNYIIRVAAADWNSTTGVGTGDLAGLGITRTDKIGNGAADLSDNDAALTTGTVIVPQIRLTTGLNGQNNHNLDFGFKALSNLGDKVWRDDNANGIQDAGEPGVAGVTVTLYNNSGSVISTTVTDAYGNYLFDNLAAGTYQVGFTPPANYAFTTQTNNNDNTTLTGGSTAANGSDVNATTGRTANIVLVAGENERNIDAGLIFSQPATNSIGDRIWFDSDGNGNQNGTEPGVSGVTVTLYASDGVTVVATTVTDANGNYVFTGLPASTNYIIGITPPVGMIAATSSGTTAGNATVNSDISQTTYKTTAVNTGAAGTQITGVDAGLVQQAATRASLGDKVWLDLPGGTANVQDANEPGVAGVTVELLDGTGASIDPDGGGPLTKTETVTDAFGNYIFNNLNAASYQVKFTLPGGYTFVTANSGTDDLKDSDPNTVTGITATYTLVAGQRNVSADAGLIKTAPAGTNRLGDKVWFDANSNGTQDAGEVGIAGVTVTLYNNLGVAIATTTSDVNGNYQFVNLADGTYSVGFSNLPAGYSLSPIWASDAANATNSDANPGTGRTGPIVLAGGVTENDIDAALVAGTASGLGSIGNKVWWDLNGGTANVQDANEPGVAGVTVTLLDAGPDGIAGNADDGASRTTTTNSLGEYIFTGLPAGNYAVQFSNLPAGASVVTANSGTNDNIDSDGLPLGTGGAPAGASRTAVYNLATGQDNLTIDLGLSNAAKGSFGDRVWYDNGVGGGTANDGILNGTEIGVAGVTVTLVNAAGQTIDRAGVVTATPISTTTDANGYYAFADLTAGVSFAAIFSNLPVGFNFTAKSGVGGGDNNRSDADLVSGLTPAVAIVANTHNTTLDAGITSARASLGNYVWLDTNGDGIQDVTEAGVPGVTVTLYRPGFGLDGIAGNADDVLPVTSMVTDQNGGYLFTNLEPGTYQTEFSTIPGGLSFTKQNTPGDNADNTNSDAIPTAGNPSIGRTGNIVLTAGEVDVTIDAGLFKPRAVIGNYVWADTNSDGIQQATEPAAPGISVTLLNGSGNPVAVAITDANGFYMFPNVAPGTYSLSFANLPTGVSFTTPNLGGDDNLDSDVIGTTITGIVVTTTTVNLSFDAGVIGLSVLPVRLVFTAVRSGNAAVLTWKVYDEIGVKSYTLERSVDGSNFSAVVNYTSDGRAEYNKTDAQPVTGLNYYRVKIENIDGKIEYSEIRVVRFDAKGIISVFPNPAKDNINIQLPDSWQGKKVTLEIINQLGQVIISKSQNQASQVETINISRLARGTYNLRLVNSNEKVEVRKIQVMH